MTTSVEETKPILDPGTLYIGENGRIYCGRDAGMTASYTGYDIDGSKVRAVLSADVQRDEPGINEWAACECCGLKVSATTEQTK